MPIQKLLFVDTNIWLDFYRVKNEAALSLLEHAEAVSDRLIVTFQVESEFKKNRQAVIADSLKELKQLPQIGRPGIFSDAKAVKMVNKGVSDANKRIAGLRTRLMKALDNPALHDPVYKACQRIFHKQDHLTLTRENKLRYVIRRKAFRRFIHGCPPRKRDDTSLGDAFNWEWMIHCANENNAELVIVSRDQDYGQEIEKKVYVNDHLRQEFSERVSKKKKLLLYNKLSDALKHFQVKVTEAEEAVEAEIIAGNHDVDKKFNSFLRSSQKDADLTRWMQQLASEISKRPDTEPEAEGGD
jgi:predicted nucleic acid-binding protein